MCAVYVGWSSENGRKGIGVYNYRVVCVCEEVYSEGGVQRVRVRVRVRGWGGRAVELTLGPVPPCGALAVPRECCRPAARTLTTPTPPRPLWCWAGYRGARCCRREQPVPK